MLWQRTLVASILAVGAQAGGIGALIAEGMSRSNRGMERRLEDIAKANLRARGFVQARQTPGGTSTPLTADGSIDMEAWNTAANSACRDALKGIPEATNPSGTCVCYNLPLLNSQTGTFEADLRLFQISSPRGEFQGIPPDKIEVELSYNGASVSEVNGQPVPPTRLKLRQAADTTTTNTNNTGGGDLPLIKSYLFVGQVDQDRMSNGPDKGKLQALVMPIVTLKATNNAGQQVTTNVSSNEASFVTGEFSNDVDTSTFGAAQLAVDAEVAALLNGTVAFVLPGVQLMIFPIGLIITGTWLVVGVAVYGMGTFARYNFREAHRRRVKTVQKGGMARI
ncbi:hypothetical protein B0J18DRAFT_71209 [Chaetomium sp. MPI-SDFR-AT-0129]|nr:hypothetical protein B0J18DRAFT_71209 [Chaetomium sp. MPI-SDFR-AT-0129]